MRRSDRNFLQWLQGEIEKEEEGGGTGGPRLIFNSVALRLTHREENKKEKQIFAPPQLPRTHMVTKRRGKTKAI